MWVKAVVAWCFITTVSLAAAPLWLQTLLGKECTLGDVHIFSEKRVVMNSLANYTLYPSEIPGLLGQRLEQSHGNASLTCHNYLGTLYCSGGGRKSALPMEWFLQKTRRELRTRRSDVAFNWQSG